MPCPGSIFNKYGILGFINNQKNNQSCVHRLIDSKTVLYIVVHGTKFECSQKDMVVTYETYHKIARNYHDGSFCLKFIIIT